jgi:hypothetical protein
MIWDVIIVAFVITTLGVVFCAVPIYCLLRASDFFGRLNRRISNTNRPIAAPVSPREPSLSVIEGVLQFPMQRVPSRLERAELTEERVDQLAS